MIGTKFPSYFARHPRKVSWLVHQHRAAYELAGTIYSDFGHDERDVGLKEKLLALDEQMLGECVGRYTISRTVSDRLRQLQRPRLRRRCITRRSWPLGSRPGPRPATCSRWRASRGTSASIWSCGRWPTCPSRSRWCSSARAATATLIERAAEEAGVTSRVRFAGAVHDDALVTLYREALALAYVPFDEDYGLATLEAFLAAKPVVTAADSGGTLEFVQHDVNGLVSARRTRRDRRRARAARRPSRRSPRGSARPAATLALGITWDAVIDRLVSHG